MKKDSNYTFDFLGYAMGSGSFMQGEFIYKIGEIEYHYPLSIPTHELYISGDFDHDGQIEKLQDNGKEIFVVKDGGQKLPVHQISDLAQIERENLFYAPILIKGYAILVSDLSANGSDSIHIYYYYSLKSQTFEPLTFEYSDGKKDQVFYGRVRRTEPGGVEGITRVSDNEGNWSVTFYNITFENDTLKVSEKDKEPGGWPTWWVFEQTSA